MNPEARVGLEVAKAAVERAADEVDAAAQLRASAINKAVELGESYRDIAAVLGVPHTTVHHFVKPYVRPA
jgi:DNA-directed RNA polymerase specialized sigma24 family protein